MFKNRYALITAMIFALIVSLAVANPFSTDPKSVDLSWPPRPVNIPVTDVEEDPPYIMDSATRSYVAWGEALERAGKLSDSGVCSNTTQENIFAGIPNNLDSATRSYMAWGLALRAKDEIRASCR